MNKSIIIPHIDEFPELNGKKIKFKFKGNSSKTYIYAGAFAGLVEHTFMYPVDTVKTRMQALRQPNYLGISNAFQSIIKSEGILGLYSGLSAVLVGAIPSHALSFMTYEFMKKKLTDEDEDHHRPSNFTAAISGASATIVHDFVSTPLDVIKQSNIFIYLFSFRNASS
jgi:solute carrier family 25 (mitochondrial iron transporter), member 28/37